MIMYDEPFTGQDPISKGVLVSLIRELNDASRLSSIVVSHDVDETIGIADYVYIIANGAVMCRGRPGQLAGERSDWVRQFLDGERDGPVHFHYPGATLEQDMFGMHGGSVHGGSGRQSARTP